MKGANSEESNGEYGDLYHVSDGKNSRPISLKIHLEDRPVPMELDTGSVVSVMSEGVYQQYLRHVPLKDTPLKLRTYMSGQVKPMGFCNTTVQCKGQCKELPTTSLRIRDPLSSTENGWSPFTWTDPYFS